MYSNCSIIGSHFDVLNIFEHPPIKYIVVDRFLCPLSPNPYGETLLPNVTVLGGRAFEKWLGLHEVKRKGPRERD